MSRGCFVLPGMPGRHCISAGVSSGEAGDTIVFTKGDKLLGWCKSVKDKWTAWSIWHAVHPVNISGYVRFSIKNSFIKDGHKLRIRCIAIFEFFTENESLCELSSCFSTTKFGVIILYPPVKHKVCVFNKLIGRASGTFKKNNGGRLSTVV